MYLKLARTETLIISKVILIDREILKSLFFWKTPDENKKTWDENITLFETNILPKKIHATNCYTMRLSKNKNFSIEQKYLTGKSNENRSLFQ